MLARVLSAHLLGIDAFAVDVEVDLAHRGLPHFNIVGLPDTAVKESRDRIRAAFKNVGFSFPIKQITVNLAPADLKKEGSSFDLPIALGILAAEGHLPKEILNDFLVVGELSLEGKIKSVKGALCIASKLKEFGIKKLVIPRNNAYEVAVVKDIDVYPVSDLSETVAFLRGEKSITPLKIDDNLVDEHFFMKTFPKLKDSFM